MNKFVVKSRDLTPNTVVYDVHLSEKCIATFGLEFAAIKFMKYMEYHNIDNIQVWRRVPNIVKTNFISCTAMLHPNF